MPRLISPHTIIIHHTAGGNLSGAESALKSRGLAYHYMIDKDGTVYEYAKPSRRTYHAYKRATGTVGISYVGGRTAADFINEAQMASLEELIVKLKREYPTIKKLSGHKHMDPRTKSSRWPYKVDPYWPGDTPNGYVDGHNWKNDRYHMDRLCKLSGLQFYSELIPMTSRYLNGEGVIDE